MDHEDRSDLVVGGITIAFGAIVLFVLIPYGVDNPGSINVMALGPSFWPSVVAGLLIVMGSVIGIGAFRRSRLASREEAPAEPDFVMFRWLASLVLLAGLYLGLHSLGMVLSSIIALVLFMILGGERRPLVVAGIALVLPLALFGFFRYAANVVIPLGVLEPWLG